jgi:G3E family GTPase
VKSEFVQALEALMERRDRFDYVLIETTGDLFFSISLHDVNA